VISKLINSIEIAERKFCSWLCTLIYLIYLMCTFSAMAQSPIVSELALENGVRVLYAPRPGCGAIHAAWFIEGGRNDTGTYPPVSADILLAAWFSDFDMLGASGFWMKTTASGISHGRDITPETLEDWCRAELNRLTQVIRPEQIDSARCSLQSQRREPDPMAKLCTLISSGNISDTSSQTNTMGLDSISISNLQSLADKYVDASRLLVVLIGDVKESQAKDVLNEHFGRLNASANLPPKVIIAAKNDDAIQRPLDERKTVMPSEEKTEVLVAWPISPNSHGNRSYLELYAEILAGSTHSALLRNLVNEKGCSNNVQVLVGVQGECPENLFVIRADVVDGHTVQEVESAIQNHVQSTLHNGLQDAEINRAVNRIDTKRALHLADASGLAQALIWTHENLGDWSLALAQISDGVNLEQRTSTLILRSILQPGSTYSILVERDPIRSPRNQEQAHLVLLLFRLLGDKLNEPAQRETLIKNTIRQYELMPGEMRGQLLSLFESETAR